MSYLTYVIQAIPMQNAARITKEARTEDHREADRIAKGFRKEGYRSIIRTEEG